MVEPRTECPTPDEVEARLNDMAQIYDLGIALREVRIRAAEGTNLAWPSADRVCDPGPGPSVRGESENGDLPGASAGARPSR